MEPTFSRPCLSPLYLGSRFPSSASRPLQPLFPGQAQEQCCVLPKILPAWKLQL